MKTIKKVLFIIAISILSMSGVAYASSDINLTIRDGSNIVFTGPVALNTTGTITLNDSGSIPRSIDSKSVLSLINDADILSSDFSISSLTYYSSYGSLYLKCINETSGGEKCDDWQYTVNNSYPSLGMDKNILSGGENVYVYFGPQHKTSLSSSAINTLESLTVTTEDYDYQKDAWVKRTGVTAGIIQPDPSNPWTPIEIKTLMVDSNGQAIFSLIPVGLYDVGIKEDFYFPTEAFTVTNPPNSGNSGVAIIPLPTSPTEINKKFDIKKGFEFIISQQKENGSFGEDLYTDWTALALATTDDFKDQKIKLSKYLTDLKTNDYQLTDNERHSMALMAQGINPYNVNGENYIEKILSSFDGKQFGDIKIDNDDIFALIVLQNTGYTKDEDIIKSVISYIISKQKENGSWDDSVDMTGAAMESISFNQENEETKNALKKAKDFLKEKQLESGGWNNVSSTAWAIEGILSINEKPEDWVRNNNTPVSYLTSSQDTDGGMKNSYLQNKIWETVYAVTSLSSKNWNQIMQKFEKPKVAPESIIKIENIKIEQENIIQSAIPKKDVLKINKENNKSKNTIKKITPTNIKNVNVNNTQTQPIRKNWFTRFINRMFNF